MQTDALGLGRVKTFRPRETGDAKLNLACYRNCEPIRRERSGGADAHPSRLDRRDDKDINHANRIILANPISRHTGNSVPCPRSIPSTKQFIRSLR